MGIKRTAEKTTIDFSPVLSDLYATVADRIGPDRKPAGERKKAAKFKRKEAERKKRGLVRVTVDVLPDTRSELQQLAADLGVPVSQVADVLIAWAMEMEAKGAGPGLPGLRSVNTASRRYDYTLERGAPINTEGHPLGNVRGTP